MSWLQNILNKTSYQSCGMWKCCEQNAVTKINSIYFWKNLKNQNIEETIPFKLIYEKTVYLEDGFDSILTIGINPQTQFTIGAKIEINSSNSITYLMGDTLLRLLECINERFNERAVFPDVLTKEDQDIPIQITPFYEQFYKIKIGDDYLKVKETTLLSLLKKKVFIKMLIQLLEGKRKESEITFFRLLNHFCYPKSVEESLQLSKLIYSQYFFEEMFNFNCECIEKSFILEIAFNLLPWFVKCIPTFIETIMLDEKIRFHSFHLGWPHEKAFISIKILAKTGFYFAGVNDCVKCVFCGINLDSWKTNDNIIHEHFKYSSSCKFLFNPEKTDNITESSQKELKEIMKQLYSLLYFDEVDNK